MHIYIQYDIQYTTIKKYAISTEGLIHYPDRLLVRSSGGVARFLPSYLGLYERLANISHSGRPVWGHQERGDRFLLYRGEIFTYFSLVPLLS